MSDSPPPPNENDSSSIWRQPDSTSVWRAPEKSQQTGWRVPTLPTELEEDPQDTGEWHLPKPEDTVFSPEDEIEITQEQDTEPSAPPEDSGPVAPEDQLFEDTQVTLPEDLDLPDAEDDSGPVAPEDLIYLMEQDSSDDEDEGSVPMSELIALASLSEEESPQNVIQGADSPAPAFDLTEVETDEDEEDDLDTGRLSPAERLMMQSDQGDPGDYARQQLEALQGGGEAAEAPPTTGDTGQGDPGDYARQQLEALQGGGTGAYQPVDVDQGTGETDIDPGEYARRQLEQFGGGVDAGTGGMTPAPQPTQQLDPREQELLRRFTQTQDQVAALRRQMQTGQISEDDFINQLRNLMILDDDQVWWMMGVETDTWYKSEGNAWVPATPPVLQKAENLQGGQPSQFNQPVQDSLPYIDDQRQQYSQYGQYSERSDDQVSSPQDIRLDENNMPLPNQVPVEDPNATVPSAGAYNFGQDRASAETVPGQSYFESTVPSGAVDQEYGRIESPIDQAEPPDYSAIGTQEESSIYEEAAERRQESTRRTAVLVAAVVFGLALLAGGGFILGALLWYNGIVGEFEPQIAALADFEPQFQSVEVLDSTGDRIAILTREGDDRRSVPLDQVSDVAVHAFLTLENPRFYQDPGWDFFSTMRAFWNNFVLGQVVSGGSTITQQVARSLVLQSAEVTASRKLDELVVAGELTQRYTKDEILELYLNDVVFFGNQTYGIEAAAQFYFNKSAAELNWPEAALLASIVQAPTANDPVSNRENALQLMRTTMDRMAEQGCVTVSNAGEELCLTQQDLESGDVAVALARVQARRFDPREFGVSYPHFTIYVQNQLQEIFGNSIYQGGYTVTTTLDADLQEFVQSALADRVEELAQTGINTGAVLVADPRTGAILAMVGSPDFNDTEIDGQVNNTLAFHQPASTIKPILYAAALDGLDLNGNGGWEIGEYYTPATILWDVTTDFGGGYVPTNFRDNTYGPVSLRFALQNSLNIPAVKVYDDLVGINGFQDIGRVMGLTFAEGASFDLTTALGSTDVRLIDLVQAYGAIAAGGQRQPLFVIQSIEDANGNPIPIPVEEATPALDPQTAFLLQNILSDDTARAAEFGQNTALTINGLPTQNVVGAKTGTSDNSRDLWTMGFTSNRVVGVWLGTPDNEPTFNTTGFTAAAPLWNLIMREALQDNSPRQFTAPGDIITIAICQATGTTTGNTINCPSAPVNEFFARDRQPPGPNQAFFRTVTVDSWTGQIANEFCPGQQITRTFVDIDDQAALRWLNETQAGQNYAASIGLTTPLEQAPAQECGQGTPNPIANVSSPSGGMTVQGEIAITGQVQAGEEFNRYELQYAPQNTENFQRIFINGQPSSTTQQSAPGSVLANWDTSAVPNGDYTLQLTVFANDGGFLSRNYQVTVNNPEPTPTPLVPTNTPAPTLPPVSSPLPFPTLDEAGPTTVPNPGG